MVPFCPQESQTSEGASCDLANAEWTTSGRGWARRRVMSLNQLNCRALEVMAALKKYVWIFMNVKPTWDPQVPPIALCVLVLCLGATVSYASTDEWQCWQWNRQLRNWKIMVTSEWLPSTDMWHRPSCTWGPLLVLHHLHGHYVAQPLESTLLWFGLDLSLSWEATGSREYSGSLLTWQDPMDMSCPRPLVLYPNKEWQESTVGP